MNFSDFLLFVRKQLSLLKICSVVAMLGSLSACSSGSWLKQADSAMPIEAIDLGSGNILGFRAHETSDRLYVAGIAKPHQLMRPAHVDIRLIAADGRIIGEGIEYLDSPRHPRIGHGHRGIQRFVASFPLSEARQAAKIRVVYHGGIHGK
jgi:hypothetical protein